MSWNPNQGQAPNQGQDPNQPGAYPNQPSQYGAPMPPPTNDPYSAQQGGYQHAVIPLTAKARQFLARLLENIDRSIADGFLPPAPQKDACEICDYRMRNSGLSAESLRREFETRFR